MNALQAIRKYAGSSLQKGAPIVTGNTRIGGTGSSGNLGDWLSGDSSGNIYNSNGRKSAVWIPGTHINWDMITAEIISCPAAAACLNWKARNRPQAPPVIEQSDEKNEWQAVAHPLGRKLRRPNAFYDGDTLLNMASFSLDTNGNAYLVAEYTKGGDLGELWWWPHNWVTIPPEYSTFIESYVLRDQLGRHIEVPAENVFHLKWGLDPEDWRFGMSPLAASKRGVYSLQQSSNYRANILRNFGTVGVIFSPKDGQSTFVPEDVKAAWKDKTSGDNVGSAFAIDVPIDVEFPAVTPQSMAIETMDDRPEADTCALFGLPPQVVGLHVGRLSKTFANYAEARESAWEECIMPENLLLSRQVGFRALPLYVRNSSPAAVEAYLEQFRIGFDYKHVRPLQPDMDALHKRAREDWKFNLLTLGEWCKIVGRDDPPVELADLRYRDLAMVAPVEEEEKPDDEEDKGSKRWDLRELLEMDTVEALEKMHAGSALGNGVGH